MIIVNIFVPILLEVLSAAAMMAFSSSQIKEHALVKSTNIDVIEKMSNNLLFTQQISTNVLPILTTVTRSVKTPSARLNVLVETDMFYLLMEGPAWILTSV